MSSRKFDIFFSISQTPVAGQMGGSLPSEATMFRNFLEQVQAADALGFDTAWVAESHLSSEVQKTNSKPVIPHWKGEVGLNTDILQLAQCIFGKTKRINVGSAVMNILCNGGPIAHAERLAAFASIHGLDPAEKRKLRVGFAAGRFDFCNRATGIKARTPAEELAWPIVKSKVFQEAAEIFVRLFRGETLSSENIPSQNISATDFRSVAEWKHFCDLSAHEDSKPFPLKPRWIFEKIKIVPQDFRRELISLVIGTHEPKLQEYVNLFWPVQVFNLSITKPEIIENTHQRMTNAFNSQGGPWQREYMPRTVFVFLNEEPGLTPEVRRARAQEEARVALGAYWTALEGTLDSKKVENAADNALIGNGQDIAQQMLERFHPQDRLMLWFDFFNHDSKRVIRNMENFMKLCAPLVLNSKIQSAARAASNSAGRTAGKQTGEQGGVS